jgi:hypothetical protein
VKWIGLAVAELTVDEAADCFAGALESNCAGDAASNNTAASTYGKRRSFIVGTESDFASFHLNVPVY